VDEAHRSQSEGRTSCLAAPRLLERLPRLLWSKLRNRIPHCPIWIKRRYVRWLVQIGRETEFLRLFRFHIGHQFNATLGTPLCTFGIRLTALNARRGK
jgi:hypothetical protein